MRKLEVVADGKPLDQETRCKEASICVVALRALIEDATDGMAPAGEADAKRPADAKPRSTCALASVASG